MKLPSLKPFLSLAFLALFFVAIACTSERPNLKEDNGTGKAEPTQSATSKTTETLSQTPAVPSLGHSEGKSLISNSDANRRTINEESLIAQRHSQNSNSQQAPDELAPIQEMVQRIVDAVHQRIQNGEIDLAKENNIDVGRVNISTTGGGPPFGNMIYVKNIVTKDFITIGWVQSASGYELLGYSFPSRSIKANCSGPCPIYYPTSRH
jgi:hypothetical protein